MLVSEKNRRQLPVAVRSSALVRPLTSAHRSRSQIVRRLAAAFASAGFGLLLLGAFPIQMRQDHFIASALFVIIALLAGLRFAGSSTRTEGGGRTLGVLQESWLTAVLATSATIALGFLASVEISRHLVLLQGLTHAVVAPALLVPRSPRLGDRRARPMRIGAFCSEDQFAVLRDALLEPCPPVLESPRGADLVVRFTDVPDLTAPEGVRVAAVRDLVQVCHEERLDIVVAGESALRTPEVIDLAHHTDLHHIDVVSPAVFFERLFMKVPLVNLDLTWFLGLGGRRQEFYRGVQYTRDSFAALLGLVVLVALLPLIAAAIALESGRPIFFRQKRVGLQGRHFDIIKFRTMRRDAEASGPRFATAKDSRITRVGGFLRKTRLDELPQVVNVIRGDMAFVGPRPERPEFVSSYSRQLPFYDHRHRMRPGVTGWAQVTEGYCSSLEDTQRKLERDLFYLKHQSMALDAMILTKTVRGVFALNGR